MTFMVIPHAFPSVVAGNNPPLLVVGAGLSLEEIDLAKILDGLPLAGVVPCANPDPCFKPNDKHPRQCLYCVAETKLAELKQSPSIDEHLRFGLARWLTLFNDDRWLGRVELPLGRNYIRHRMIARLAADRRLAGIICFNWDCFLEAAFEAIGISTNAPVGSRPGHVKRYAVVVRNSTQGSANMRYVFRIFKPHGCRRDLDRALEEYPTKEPVFIVTRSDIESEKDHINSDVDNYIRSELKGRPLLVAGWRGGEPYFFRTLEEIVDDLDKSSTDRLSVIDRDWQHDHFAELFASSEGKSFVKVGSHRDTDRLFSWIYAHYALAQLREVAADGRLLDQLPILEGIFNELDAPTQSHDDTLLSFFDDFLPTWSRLCAIAGITTFKGIAPHHIPLGPRDWHFPFETYGDGDPFSNRPDLAAAVRLLCSTAQGYGWRFKQFPGALWRPSARHLVVPLPFGTDVLMPANTLAGIKPLVEDWRRQPEFARIDEVRILLLGAIGDHRQLLAQQSEALSQDYASGLARHFPVARLGAVADTGNALGIFSLITLDQLKEAQ